MKKAVEVLRSGGIVAFKTDTVMGLGANGFDKFAVKKLFELKNRDYEKPVSVLLPTVSKIFDYAIVGKFAFEVIKKHFPGAITCILRTKKCIYTTPLSCGETTGIRVPKLPELQEFLAELDFPLVATSANISGRPPLSDKNDVLNTFGKSVYYLDFGYNIKMSGIASTVADCSGDKILVLRKGSIEI
jgi:L-threonylcarbamoyladenylate synthase